MATEALGLLWDKSDEGEEQSLGALSTSNFSSARGQVRLDWGAARRGASVQEMHARGQPSPVCDIWAQAIVTHPEPLMVTLMTVVEMGRLKTNSRLGREATRKYFFSYFLFPFLF